MEAAEQLLKERILAQYRAMLRDDIRSFEDDVLDPDEYTEESYAAYEVAKAAAISASRNVLNTATTVEDVEEEINMFRGAVEASRVLLVEII